MRPLFLALALAGLSQPALAAPAPSADPGLRPDKTAIGPVAYDDEPCMCPQPGFPGLPPPTWPISLRGAAATPAVPPGIPVIVPGPFPHEHVHAGLPGEARLLPADIVMTGGGPGADMAVGGYDRLRFGAARPQ